MHHVLQLYFLYIMMVNMVLFNMYFVVGKILNTVHSNKEKMWILASKM